MKLWLKLAKINTKRGVKDKVRLNLSVETMIVLIIEIRGPFFNKRW